jgi:hypothetical protein
MQSGVTCVCTAAADLGGDTTDDKTDHRANCNYLHDAQRRAKREEMMSYDKSLISEHNPSKAIALRNVAIGATAIGAAAVGAFAVGAFAIGALAIGRLAIRRLAIDRVRFKSVEIDELTVKRIHASEITVADSLHLPGSSSVVTESHTDK